MNEPTLGNMTQRMDRLERQNRRMKLVGVLVLVGIAAVIVMGQAGPKKQRAVAAQQFALDDQNGKNRGYFAVTPDGMTHLILVDSKRDPRFVLAVNPDGGTSLNIYDEEKNRMSLSASELTFFNGDKERLRLWFDDGDPKLNYFDKYGKSRFALGLHQGAPLIAMTDGYGNVGRHRPFGGDNT